MAANDVITNLSNVSPNFNLEDYVGRPTPAAVPGPAPRPVFPTEYTPTQQELQMASIRMGGGRGGGNSPDLGLGGAGIIPSMVAAAERQKGGRLDDTELDLVGQRVRMDLPKYMPGGTQQWEYETAAGNYDTLWEQYKERYNAAMGAAGAPTGGGQAWYQHVTDPAVALLAGVAKGTVGGALNIGDILGRKVNAVAEGVTEFPAMVEEALSSGLFTSKGQDAIQKYRDKIAAAKGERTWLGEAGETWNKDIVDELRDAATSEDTLEQRKIVEQAWSDPNTSIAKAIQTSIINPEATFSQITDIAGNFLGPGTVTKLGKVESVLNGLSTGMRRLAGATIVGAPGAANSIQDWTSTVSQIPMEELMKVEENQAFVQELRNINPNIDQATIDKAVRNRTVGAGYDAVVATSMAANVILASLPFLKTVEQRLGGALPKVAETRFGAAGVTGGSELVEETAAGGLETLGQNVAAQLAGRDVSLGTGVGRAAAQSGFMGGLTGGGIGLAAPTRAPAEIPEPEGGTPTPGATPPPGTPGTPPPGAAAATGAIPAPPAPTAGPAAATPNPQYNDILKRATTAFGEDPKRANAFKGAIDAAGLVTQAERHAQEILGPQWATLDRAQQIGIVEKIAEQANKARKKPLDVTKPIEALKAQAAAVPTTTPAAAATAAPGAPAAAATAAPGAAEISAAPPTAGPATREAYEKARAQVGIEAWGKLNAEQKLALANQQTLTEAEARPDVPAPISPEESLRQRVAAEEAAAAEAAARATGAPGPAGLAPTPTADAAVGAALAPINTALAANDKAGAQARVEEARAALEAGKETLPEPLVKGYQEIIDNYQKSIDALPAAPAKEAKQPTPFNKTNRLVAALSNREKEPANEQEANIRKMPEWPLLLAEIEKRKAASKDGIVDISAGTVAKMFNDAKAEVARRDALPKNNKMKDILKTSKKTLKTDKAKSIAYAAASQVRDALIGHGVTLEEILEMNLHDADALQQRLTKAGMMAPPGTSPIKEPEAPKKTGAGKNNVLRGKGGTVGAKQVVTPETRKIGPHTITDNKVTTPPPVSFTEPEAQPVAGANPLITELRNASGRRISRGNQNIVQATWEIITREGSSSKVGGAAAGALDAAIQKFAGKSDANTQVLNDLIAAADAVFNARTEAEADLHKAAKEEAGRGLPEGAPTSGPQPTAFVRSWITNLHAPGGNKVRISTPFQKQIEQIYSKLLTVGGSPGELYNAVEMATGNAAVAQAVVDRFNKEFEALGKRTGGVPTIRELGKLAGTDIPATLAMQFQKAADAQKAGWRSADGRTAQEVALDAARRIKDKIKKYKAEDVRKRFDKEAAEERRPKSQAPAPLKRQAGAKAQKPSQATPLKAKSPEPTQPTDLKKEGWPKADARYGDSIEVTLKDGTKATLVIEDGTYKGTSDAEALNLNPRNDDGRIVAYVGGKEVGSLDYLSNHGDIHSGVNKEWRRRGIGTMLYDAAEALGVDIKGRRGALSVSPDAEALRAAREARAQGASPEAQRQAGQEAYARATAQKEADERRFAEENAQWEARQKIEDEAEAKIRERIGDLGWAQLSPGERIDAIDAEIAKTSAKPKPTAEKLAEKIDPAVAEAEVMAVLEGTDFSNGPVRDLADAIVQSRLDERNNKPVLVNLVNEFVTDGLITKEQGSKLKALGNEVRLVGTEQVAHLEEAQETLENEPPADQGPDADKAKYVFQTESTALRAIDIAINTDPANRAPTLFKMIALHPDITAAQRWLALKLSKIAAGLNIDVRRAGENEETASAAWYSRADNEMVFRAANPEVVLHEGVHGVTASVLEYGKGFAVQRLNARLQDIRKAVQTYYKANKADAPPYIVDLMENADGILKNNHELMAYGMTSPEVHKYLARIPFKQNQGTTWDGFKRAVREFFGAFTPEQHNALDALIETTGQLLEYVENNPSVAIQATQSAKDKSTSAKDKFTVFGVNISPDRPPTPKEKQENRMGMDQDDSKWRWFGARFVDKALGLQQVMQKLVRVMRADGQAGFTVPKELDISRAKTLFDGMKSKIVSDDTTEVINPAVDWLHNNLLRFTKIPGDRANALENLNKFFRSMTQLNRYHESWLEKVGLHHGMDVRRQEILQEVRETSNVTDKPRILELHAELEAIVNTYAKQTETAYGTSFNKYYPNFKADLKKLDEELGINEQSMAEFNTKLQAVRDRVQERTQQSGNADVDDPWITFYGDKWYVPLKGEKVGNFDSMNMDFGGVDEKMSLNILNSQLKLAKGTTQPLKNGIERLLADNIAAATRAAEKQHFTETLYNFVLKYKDQLGAKIYVYKGRPKEGYEQISEGGKKGRANREGIHKRLPASNGFTLHEGDTHYVVDLPKKGDLFRALVELNAETDQWALTQIAGMFTNYLSKSYTVWKPYWTLFTSLTRDVTYVPVALGTKDDSIMSGLGMMGKYYKALFQNGMQLGNFSTAFNMIFSNSEENVKEYAKNNPESATAWIMRYQAAGGGVNLRGMFNSANMRNKLTSSFDNNDGLWKLAMLPKALDKWAINFASVLETTSRVAAFRALVEDGQKQAIAAGQQPDMAKIEREAAITTKDVLNYDQQGAWSKSVNSYVAFFKVGMTSADVMRKNFTRPDGSIDYPKAMKWAGVLSAISIAGMAMTRAIGGDDEEEKPDKDGNKIDKLSKIDINTLTQNFIVYIDGEPWKIPIGLGLPQLLMAPGIIAESYLHGDINGAEAGKAFHQLFVRNAPVRAAGLKEDWTFADFSDSVWKAMTPTAFAPIQQLAGNTGVFGEPIHRQTGYGSEEQYASEQGKVATDQLWKDWATGLRENFGIDAYPETLKFAANSYLAAIPIDKIAKMQSATEEVNPLIELSNVKVSDPKYYYARQLSKVSEDLLPAVQDYNLLKNQHLSEGMDDKAARRAAASDLARTPATNRQYLAWKALDKASDTYNREKKKVTRNKTLSPTRREILLRKLDSKLRDAVNEAGKYTE